MFTSPELAAHIDRAEGPLGADIARAHANKLIGAGFYARAAPRAEGSDLDFLISHHLGGRPHWKIEI